MTWQVEAEPGTYKGWTRLLDEHKSQHQPPFIAQTPATLSLLRSLSTKMVKLSTVAFTVVCALPSLAAAAKCTNGLFYCGYNLKRKGSPSLERTICPVAT